MVEKNDDKNFLKLTDELPVVDVRSPAEFDQGHIPGAVSLPLFSNEERAVVGKLYKNSGRETSVLKGLDFVGPKMSGFVKQANKIAPGRKLLMHCWRGGMRSESMAWLLSTAGFQVHLLIGGYRAYRKFIREKLETASNFVVLSGKTGSGKTETLLQMKTMGVQVIDLEGMANHKGSAFGALGENPQPTGEQFENNLYKTWSGLDPNKTIFLEDESRSIGRVILPDGFYRKMRACPVIMLDMNKSLRIVRLVKDYAKFPKEQLIESVLKIERKLGGQNAQKIITDIEAGNFAPAIDTVLAYYDKTYAFGLDKRDKDQVHTLETNTADARQNAEMVIDYFNGLGGKV